MCTKNWELDECNFHYFCLNLNISINCGHVVQGPLPRNNENKSIQPPTSIRRWVLGTRRLRLMDIGAVLADDKTFYLVFCRQEMWRVFVKRIVQCSTDEITR